MSAILTTVYSMTLCTGKNGFLVLYLYVLHVCSYSCPFCLLHCTLCFCTSPLSFYNGPLCSAVANGAFRSACPHCSQYVYTLLCFCNSPVLLNSPLTVMSSWSFSARSPGYMDWQQTPPTLLTIMALLGKVLHLHGGNPDRAIMLLWFRLQGIMLV